MYPSSRSKTMRPPSPTNFANFSPPSDYPLSTNTTTTMQGHHHHHQHHHNGSTSKINKNKNFAMNSVSSTAIAGHTEYMFPDDNDCIEFFNNNNNNNTNNNNNNNNNNNFKSFGSPGDSLTMDRRRHRGPSRRSNHKMDVEQQVKWTRKNIAATMERFEPSTPTSSLSKYDDYGATSTTLHQTGHVNHVYSYAYYEPGAAKCHTNVPYQGYIPGTSAAAFAGSCHPSTSSVGSSASSIVPIAGPSKSPPRNSIRALLAKSFRSKTLLSRNKNEPSTSSGSATAVERHNYTTRYGTTENLYEEVNEQKIRKVLSDNRIITSASPNVKEELRRVQHNHFRVLDQLNLSLEALIMPTTPPDISPTVEEKISHASSVENLSATLNSIELKDHTCINPEFDEGDLDSGFSGSGSSSGASYNESLRYYKTSCNIAAGGIMQTTTLPHNIRSCRSSTASGTSTSKSSVTSEDHAINMAMAGVCGGSGGSSSPFNYGRRCSDSQRSSSSATTSTGTKPKKNFWNLKQ